MRLKNQGTASGSVTSLSIVTAAVSSDATVTDNTGNDIGSDHRDLGARHLGAG